MFYSMLITNVVPEYYRTNFDSHCASVICLTRPTRWQHGRFVFLDSVEERNECVQKVNATIWSK